jgi:hypothetical protein
MAVLISDQHMSWIYPTHQLLTIYVSGGRRAGDDVAGANLYVRRKKNCRRIQESSKEPCFQSNASRPSAKCMDLDTIRFLRRICVQSMESAWDVMLPCKRVRALISFVIL